MIKNKELEDKQHKFKENLLVIVESYMGIFIIIRSEGSLY